MSHRSSWRRAAERMFSGAAPVRTGRGHHRSVKVTAIVAASLALLAACSVSSTTGSPGSGSADTPAATSAPVSAAKGTPYVVGNLLEVQTSFQTYPSSYSDTPIAFQDWVNAHGGINGHPLKVISLDDHADAATSLADAKQLISADHVIALVGDANPTTEAAYEQFVAQSGVPVVGSAYSSIAGVDTDWFQTAPGSYTITGYSRVLAAKAGGVTKYGIMYCTEVPACKLDYSTQATWAPIEHGITVVKTIPAAIASPNYITPCIQMKAAGVNGIYYSSSTEGVARAAVDCAQQGLRVVHVMGESGQQYLQTTQVWQYGAVGADMTMPYWADVPQTQDFRQAMAQYFPNDQLAAAPAQEWTSFEVLQAALEKVPGDPMTPATVKKGLYALPQGFHTNMSGPLEYKPGKASQAKCFFLWAIKNGKYELTKGTQYQCAP